MYFGVFRETLNWPFFFFGLWSALLSRPRDARARLAEFTTDASLIKKKNLWDSDPVADGKDIFYTRKKKTQRRKYPYPSDAARTATCRLRLGWILHEQESYAFVTLAKDAISSSQSHIFFSRSHANTSRLHHIPPSPRLSAASEYFVQPFSLIQPSYWDVCGSPPNRQRQDIHQRTSP